MSLTLGSANKINRTAATTSTSTVLRRDTPTCTNTSHHPKKSRTVFTKKQIQELENVFYQKRYLTIKDREELSRRLTLTESQVTIDVLLVDITDFRSAKFDIIKFYGHLRMTYVIFK